MKLSLSVRVAEAPCKTKLHVPFSDLVQIAAEAGCAAVCMRASAGGVQTPLDELGRMRSEVQQAGLVVSMVTADFDVPLNNDNGPNSLRDIGPSLDVAEALGTDLIRICIKKEADIPFVNKAVEQAAERGIRLAHQCHTTSLFEEVDSMLAVLEQIGHSNFGIIYEPANLMLCSQKYGQETLERLQPYLMNVYVQNHQELPEGPVELPTFCKGQVRFQHLELWEPGGVDYSEVFAGLKAISYDGFFTIHQARGIETTDDVRQYVDRCKSWFESQF